jgi:alkylhydroperoxidase family enzyme
VLEDWRTAPVGEGLRATLGLLQKLTLDPAAVTAADVEGVRAAGVSDAAIVDALYVCSYFNLIDRLADAFAFTPISHLIGREELSAYGARLLSRGYG